MAAKTSKNSSTVTKPRSTASNQQDHLSPSEKIDERIASFNHWKGEKLAEIRKLIHEADPDIVEEWEWRGTLVWEHDGIITVGDAFKEKVKFTFHNGARLPDPNKVFNAGLDGNKWRAIDLYEGDEIDEAAFKELVREAVAYNINR